MTRPGRRRKRSRARESSRGFQTEDRFSGAPEGERGETPRRTILQQMATSKGQTPNRKKNVVYGQVKQEPTQGTTLFNTT
ncbi:hypothetical protein NPIL_255231 [Nephila pilipes]|uniref:Uncharacterized protein n=1 Tax=Nephila pilipes TaxID=299642 RepID=A0A8X6MT13_NEPPI|nr:hypothetical protein NPIL_255231 [Nephila pilipes]